MFKDCNVTLMVSDMNRTIKFYTEILGFRLVSNYGGHWAEIQAPNVRIGLHPGGVDRSKDGQGGMSLGLRVEDLDSTTKTLQQRGIEFKTGNKDKGSRQAYFSDPDGYPLYLIEIKFG